MRKEAGEEPGNKVTSSIPGYYMSWLDLHPTWAGSERLRCETACLPSPPANYYYTRESGVSPFNYECDPSLSHVWVQ